VKKTKKPPPRSLVPGGTIAWLEAQIKIMEAQWKENVIGFQFQTQATGHGLYNIHILDTLRNMQALYLQIAANKQALAHAKGKFSA